jgi:hypothetical protein
MRRVAQILCFAAIGLFASRSWAAPCPADPAIGGVGQARVDVEGRLSFIESALRDGARKSTRWAAAWGTTYGVAMATLLLVSPWVEPPTRIDMYVGATSAGIGLLVRSAVHPRVIREHRRLRKRIAEHGRTCETLQEAERALVRSVKGERFGRSLAVHLGAIVYNVGVGLVLGLAFHRPVAGIRQAAVGSTVGQIMIVTQPTTSVRALDRYRLSFTPLVLPRGAGLGLAGSF